MSINMRTVEEWIAESNARHEEDFGEIVQEIKELCVAVDNATLIYETCILFWKKAEVFFFSKIMLSLVKRKKSTLKLKIKI